MAGGTGQARGEVSSEPNVVPMIDILLVLLIIFMITQPLSRMAMDVQVPPPEQTTVTPAGEQPDRAGAGRRRQLRDQRPAGARRTSWTRRSTRSSIRGRPSCCSSRPGENRLYQDVVEAMDVARGAGVQIIGFTPQEANRQQ